MESTTMTTNAATCVLSVRLRPAGQIVLADTAALGQGATVPTGMAVRAANVPFTGVVFGAVGSMTSDVVRSLPGRPPV